MRLLLDTHVLLWWLKGAPELQPALREAIADPANLVYVSAVSIWEIEIKRALHKLQMPANWLDVVADEGFRRLPVTWEHAGHVARLPAIHRDPFDRMLVAQAMIEKLVLVTDDATVRRYGVSEGVA
jgi:PIN domain nuclease of toxin-antitoxin system